MGQDSVSEPALFVFLLTTSLIMYMIMHAIVKEARKMNFYSIKDLRVETKNICENIRQNGEAVITNNGKPTLLILDISDNDFEELLRAVRQAKAMIAFNSMRVTAARNGYMTEREIEAEIAKSRAERRSQL